MEDLESCDIKAKCAEVEALLKSHARISDSIFEALAQGTLTSELETEANDVLEQLGDLFNEMMKNCSMSSPKETDQILQAIAALFAHCDAREVVNSVGLNPAVELKKKFEGFNFMKNLPFMIR